MIKIKPGCDERDVWPFRNRILDMDRTGMLGWQAKLKVQVEMNTEETMCDQNGKTVEAQ